MLPDRSRRVVGSAGVVVAPSVCSCTRCSVHSSTPRWRRTCWGKTCSRTRTPWVRVGRVKGCAIGQLDEEMCLFRVCLRPAATVAAGSRGGWGQAARLCGHAGRGAAGPAHGEGQVSITAIVTWWNVRFDLDCGPSRQDAEVACCMCWLWAQVYQRGPRSAATAQRDTDGLYCRRGTRDSRTT